MDIRQLELSGGGGRPVERDQSGGEDASITRAPSVCRLQNLAGQLKAELFVRRGRQLVPTPAGLRLAEHARKLIRQMREIRQEFANDAATDNQPFHFATGATTLIHRLGKPLRALRKEYPNTHVEVTVLPTEEIVAGLLDRRFDLGLISLPYPDEHLYVDSVV